MPKLNDFCARVAMYYDVKRGDEIEKAFLCNLSP